MPDTASEMGDKGECHPVYLEHRYLAPAKYLEYLQTEVNKEASKCNHSFPK